MSVLDLAESHQLLREFIFSLMLADDQTILIEKIQISYHLKAAVIKSLLIWRVYYEYIYLFSPVCYAAQALLIITGDVD